jgi:hypothetical protein
MRAIERMQEIETRRAAPTNGDEQHQNRGGVSRPKQGRLQTLLWYEEES